MAGMKDYSTTALFAILAAIGGPCSWASAADMAEPVDIGSIVEFPVLAVPQSSLDWMGSAAKIREMPTFARNNIPDVNVTQNHAEMAPAPILAKPKDREFKRNPRFRQALMARAKYARKEISAFKASFQSTELQGEMETPAVVPGPRPDDDVTEEFIASQRRDFSPSELNELRNKTVLVFVGGLLSNHMRTVRTDTEETPQYFEGAMRLASQFKIPHRIPDINTEQSSEHNAARLIEIVEEEAKKGLRVIFIPHSHGALDVLRAFESMESTPSKRHLLNNVSWIPVQGPFLGASGADHAAASPFHRLIYWSLESLGGSRRSVIEMTTESSMKHYRMHQRQIARILKRIPTIALASYLEKPQFPKLMPGPWAFLSALKIIPKDEKLQILAGLSKSGIKSDGLVPLASQFFKGMERVILKNRSHFEPLVASNDATGRRVFIGLMRMILNRRRHARPSVN
ncbi:MAG: hypothetical protein ACYCPQ_09175 [Elusimicrobiota bacterium]